MNKVSSIPENLCQNPAAVICHNCHFLAARIFGGIGNYA